MKIKAINTNKKFFRDYCEFCGTWTILRNGKCMNLNHKFFKNLKEKKYGKTKKNQN